MNPNSAPLCLLWHGLPFQVNVVIGTVVFEVQVALKDQVKARTAFGGHSSYNKFRCFTEIFALLPEQSVVSNNAASAVSEIAD